MFRRTREKPGPVDTPRRRPVWMAEDAGVLAAALERDPVDADDFAR